MQPLQKICVSTVRQTCRRLCTRPNFAQWKVVYCIVPINVQLNKTNIPLCS